MNKLEFNLTIKALKIGSPVENTSVGCDEEELHIWDGILIKFAGDGYAIVRGRIPLEVAEKIYLEYPSNPYKIMINGEYSDDPAKFAATTRYFDGQEFTKSDAFIRKYHIYTKEGLVIFLTEMKDYYLRKKDYESNEASKFDEIIEFINSEIIKEVNPSNILGEWKDKNIRRVTGELRCALDDFDKSVNPFEEDGFILDSGKNISINGDKSLDKSFLQITDKNTNSFVRFSSSSKGISYLFSNAYLTVSHYYSNLGELLFINGKPVTNKDNQFIIDEVVSATSYAQSITLEKQKKLNFTQMKKQD